MPQRLMRIRKFGASSEGIQKASTYRKTGTVTSLNHCATLNCPVIISTLLERRFSIMNASVWKHNCGVFMRPTATAIRNYQSYIAVSFSNCSDRSLQS